MRKLKLLSANNKRKLYSFLKKYLKEVFSEEEYINSFQEAYKEAGRVELYGNRKVLTASLISDWLRGLPIGCAFATYSINIMLVSAVNNGSYRNGDFNRYSDIDALDNFYWETLGELIYRYGKR